MAYLKARRNKRYKDEVLMFSKSLEEELLNLRNQLLSKSYKTGKYRSFYVYEPKKRLIMALPFRDRVVHHALCNIIEPIFDKIFIYDSYACRINKGTHKGADRVTKFLSGCNKLEGCTYCLKGDIRQYFPSIDHKKLLEIINKKIICPNTMWLIRQIIYSPGHSEYSKGLPIGNLTSQLFANIYLNELDYFVKHQLRIKFYVRYMDDFVILSKDKIQLHEIKREIECFLKEELDLELNQKTDIFPASQGIDFLGYRIWQKYRLLRKASVKKMKRKLKAFQQKYAMGQVDIEKIRQSLMSWLGHVSHCNSYNLRKKLFQQFVLVKDTNTTYAKNRTT